MTPMRRDNEPTSILRSPFLWAFLIGIVSLTLIRPLLRHEPAAPPLLGSLPAFELVSSTGAPFGSVDLEGQVYVANFIFTRCVTICPRLTASMDRLQRRLDDAGVEGVRLVSITVDPDYDTPERLAAYADARGIELRRWTLLTGERERVERLVTEGFRTPMGSAEPGAGGAVDVAHTGKFVLVDGSGGIRGYFDSDAGGLDEIFHRARHVRDEAVGG